MKHVPPSVSAALKRRGRDDILQQDGEYQQYKSQIDQIIHGDDALQSDSEDYENDIEPSSTPEEAKANKVIEGYGEKYGEADKIAKRLEGPISYEDDYESDVGGEDIDYKSTTDLAEQARTEAFPNPKKRKLADITYMTDVENMTKDQLVEHLKKLAPEIDDKIVKEFVREHADELGFGSDIVKDDDDIDNDDYSYYPEYAEDGILVESQDEWDELQDSETEPAFLFEGPDGKEYITRDVEFAKSHRNQLYDWNNAAIEIMKTDDLDDEEEIPDLDKGSFDNNYKLALETNNYEKAKAIYDRQVQDKGAGSPEAKGTKKALDEMSKNFDQGNEIEKQKNDENDKIKSYEVPDEIMKKYEKEFPGMGESEKALIKTLYIKGMLK